MKPLQSAPGNTTRAIASKRPMAMVVKSQAHADEQPPQGRSTSEPGEAREERIRRQAYGLYEARGRVDGHDLDDWLQAEALLGAAAADSSAAEPVARRGDGDGAPRA